MNTEKYTHFFETLDETRSLLAFGRIYADDVYFKDPFNETKGVDAVYEIFQEMYQKLDHPRFEIIEAIADDTVCYVKWRFIFAFKDESNEVSFEGVSRLEINEEGKVISHIDYWDAAENVYEKIPLLGSVLRFIKRKIAKS
jgi:limonene-1,2-epoxide hydrolase